LFLEKTDVEKGKIQGEFLSYTVFLIQHAFLKLMACFKTCKFDLKPSCSLTFSSHLLMLSVVQHLRCFVTFMTAVWCHRSKWL